MVCPATPGAAEAAPGGGSHGADAAVSVRERFASRDSPGPYSTRACGRTKGLSTPPATCVLGAHAGPAFPAAFFFAFFVFGMRAVRISRAACRADSFHHCGATFLVLLPVTSRVLSTPVHHLRSTRVLPCR